jgi:hypothetical protein
VGLGVEAGPQETRGLDFFYELAQLGVQSISRTIVVFTVSLIDLSITRLVVHFIKVSLIAQ